MHTEGVSQGRALSYANADSDTSCEEPPHCGKHSEQHLVFKRDRYTTLATFFAGGVAGACSRTLTAPLDRIKIIVQEGHVVAGGKRRLFSLKSSMLIDVFCWIRADGGWRAFWRGNGVNCMKAGPEFAIVFSLRRYFLSLYEDSLEKEQKLMQTGAKTADVHAEEVKNTVFLPRDIFLFHFTVSSVPRIFVNFCIGALAGCGAQLSLYPLEVLKTRIAVSRSNEYCGGIWEVALLTYRNGGIAEFYCGLVPNMMGVFLYRGLEVGMYSTVQQQIMMYRMQKYCMSRHDASLSSMETAAVGMFASIVAQIATYPLNVVRTRLQTQGINGRAVKYNGMVDCIVKMVRTKGVASLFSGITANCLKAVPASSCMFVVFERVQKLLVGDD